MGGAIFSLSLSNSLPNSFSPPGEFFERETVSAPGQLPPSKSTGKNPLFGNLSRKSDTYASNTPLLPLFAPPPSQFERRTDRPHCVYITRIYGGTDGILLRRRFFPLSLRLRMLEVSPSYPLSVSSRPPAMRNDEDEDNATGVADVLVSSWCGRTSACLPIPFCKLGDC